MSGHRIRIVGLSPAVTGAKRRMYRTSCSCGWEYRGDYTRHETLAAERGREHLEQAGRPPCPHPGKKKFASRERAEQSMSTVWQRSRRSGALPSRSYQCACGFWHLTKAARKDYSA